MGSNWLWTGSSWLLKLAVTSSNWLKPVLPGCWNWLWLAQTGSSWFLTCCLELAFKQLAELVWLASDSSISINSWLLKLAVEQLVLQLVIETGWLAQTGNCSSSNKPVLPVLKLVVTALTVTWLKLVLTRGDGSNWLWDKFLQSGCWTGLAQTDWKLVLPGCWNWLWLSQIGSDWLLLFNWFETGSHSSEPILRAQTNPSCFKLVVNRFFLVVENWLLWLGLKLGSHKRRSNWLCSSWVKLAWNWLWLVSKWLSLVRWVKLNLAVTSSNWFSLAMTSSNQFLLVVETGCDWLKLVLTGCWNWFKLVLTRGDGFKLVVNRFFLVVKTGCD